MALKVHQAVVSDDINFKCGEVLEKGLLLVFSSTVGYVEKVTNPSGRKVAGLLMLDVRNRDVRDDLGTTSITRNYSKNEVPVSGVVRLLRVGEVETNVVDASDTFAQGDKLYITGAGKVSKVQDNAGCERIGHALAKKDSDGFLRLWINLQ